MQLNTSPFAFLSAFNHGILTSILCGILPESAEYNNITTTFTTSLFSEIIRTLCSFSFGLKLASSQQLRMFALIVRVLR